jgi:hypothetical protein
MRKASDIIVGAASGTATALTTQTALMIANASQNISQIESRLQVAAYPRRANSTLTLSDYCLLVLGVIFVGHDLLLPRLMSRELAV